MNMKIKIVTVGKLKEKYLKDGIAEYAKRISRFATVEMVELADEKTPDRASDSAANEPTPPIPNIPTLLFFNNSKPLVPINSSFLEN